VRTADSRYPAAVRTLRRLPASALLAAAVVIGPVVAGPWALPVAGAAPARVTAPRGMAGLVTPAIPTGFAPVSTGTGTSATPRSIGKGVSASAVPVNPPVYLAPAGVTDGHGRVSTLPSYWGVWWDGTSRTQLTVALARQLDRAYARQELAALDRQFSSATGISGYSLASTFAPAGVPGGHGSVWTGPTTDGVTPRLVVEVFATGDVVDLVGVLDIGASPPTAAATAVARSQYRFASRSPATKSPPPPADGASRWWVVGAVAVAVVLVGAGLAYRITAARRRRRSAEDVTGEAGGAGGAHGAGGAVNTQDSAQDSAGRDSAGADGSPSGEDGAPSGEDGNPPGEGGVPSEELD